MNDRDPIASATRRSRSQRRIGRDKTCNCGERRSAALIPGSSPLTCFECERRDAKRSIWDFHHVSGRANHEITIPIRVNDHRAVLSERQYDWPRRTLRNPHRSPLRAAAACIRGLIDTTRYLLDALIQWIPDFLENLDEALTQHFGPRWWQTLPFDRKEKVDD